MRHSKHITLARRETRLGYSFMSIWIIGFIIFTLYPLIYSLYLSFNLVTIPAEGIQTKWIGLENFRRAISVDRVMITALWDFLKKALIMIMVINVFALIFALILNMNIKGRSFFRVVFFLPVIVASGPVIKELGNQNVLVMPGIANFRVVQLLMNIFGQKFGTLVVDIFSQLIKMFWFSGVQIIVFLAVLQKMSPEIYEAASIDGASSWEKFWKITLPSLKPIILINLIYTFIMLATFDDNEVITEIKNNMFSIVPNEGFGYAASQAWIYFIVLLLVVGILFLVFTIQRGEKPKVSFYTEGFVYNTTRYEYKETFFNTNHYALKARKYLIGSSNRQGLLVRGFIYLLISVVAFAFLYPFITLLLKSFQSPLDVLNPTVGLIPTSLYTGNYDKAFKIINFKKSLLESLYYSILPAIAQTIACAITGYALARFKFKGKNVLFIIILSTFIIPPQVIMIPTYIFYKRFGEILTNLLGFKITILNSVFAFLLPALLGQGLKSAIFIFIFYQFFRMVPKVLDEAASIDGAGPLYIFFKIAIPLAVPAIIVVFLFSTVWYWNETYLTSLYIPNARTLPVELSRFAATFRNIYPQNGNNIGENFQNMWSEAVLMAGTLVSLLPLLVIYFLLQRWFVQGIERTGITGE
mgnify:CR=1 FL=1